MCGLNGSLNLDGSSFQITEEYITRMRDTMIHRGPDGAGTWVHPRGHIGLGHRRLSIIDLSETAGQPMHSADGRWHLVFNGEIYNHAEIRKELQARGHTDWRTSHSDTEVLLRSFMEWGIDCVHRFRGMFAFAMWDDRRRELWLVRDRIGIKPLYYSHHHGRVVFASEIKALLADPDQPRAVHEEAFFHYLSFLTTPAPQTLFDGIKKLPGGHWLRVTADGQFEEKRYWDVWEHVQPRAGTSDSELADSILHELRQAVQLRKVGDVPVGVFLSGGIDSSTNAALFSEGESQPVKTFTIGYEGEYETYQNETHYARMMAREVNAAYHEHLLDVDDLLDFLPRMIHLQDEPIADPVCVPVYYVSKLARDHGVTVCQVGEGADELFWGYAGWKQALRVQKWDHYPVPRLAKKLGVEALRFGRRDRSLPFEWLRRASLGQPVFWGGAEAFLHTQKMQLLSPRLREKFRRLTSWEALRPMHDRFRKTAWEPSDLNWMSYVDLNLRLPELLLMRVDKMSMGVSLESRVPFLDHRFVELAMSIPEQAKTRDQQSKYLLKKAVRGVIPDELIDRKKQGFGVPVYEWFFGRLGEHVTRELEEFCEQTDFLDPVAVRELIASRQGPQVWYLLNFALWWKHYIQGGTSSAAPEWTTNRRSAA